MTGVDHPLAPVWSKYLEARRIGEVTRLICIREGFNISPDFIFGLIIARHLDLLPCLTKQFVSLCCGSVFPNLHYSKRLAVAAGVITPINADDRRTNQFVLTPMGHEALDRIEAALARELIDRASS